MLLLLYPQSVFRLHKTVRLYDGKKKKIQGVRITNWTTWKMKKKKGWWTNLLCKQRTKGGSFYLFSYYTNFHISPTGFNCSALLSNTSLMFVPLIQRKESNLATWCLFGNVLPLFYIIQILFFNGNHLSCFYSVLTPSFYDLNLSCFNQSNL